QKRTALRTLLGEQAKESGNPFLTVSDDAEDCLFANMKKLLSRMTIFNPDEPERFPMHHAYIREVLSQNKKLLGQYDNLIIEISQIGDSTQLPDLDRITEALRELRGAAPETTEAEEMQKGQYYGEI
ncbi:MAG: hypothetical protein K6F80_00875, partial [Oscillospiraceae bacterium]|nr:hypothetical protein [Oscillospiraceae bacterium]